MAGLYGLRINTRQTREEIAPVGDYPDLSACFDSYGDHMSGPRVLVVTTKLVGFAGLLVMAFWFGQMFWEAKKVAEFCFSYSRFSQLRAALLIYHDLYGAFPPTKYQAHGGAPVHSWRVLLAPYTTDDFADWYAKKHEKYDFSQEWNCAHNLAAMDFMPPLYTLDREYPSDGRTRRTTDFLAIGEGDEWPGERPGRPLRALLVTKGADRFLLVEYPGSGIHWMEPRY